MNAAPAADPITFVAFRHLVLDPALQARSLMNQEAIDSYSERYANSQNMPPILLYFDGGQYWVADGWHRIAGAQNAGLKGLEARVRRGSRRDAILYAVGANAAHGVKRTHNDIRRAVRILLEDPEWSVWSDREIGRACKIDHKTVAKHRQELHDERLRKQVGNSPHTETAATVRLCERNGTQYQHRVPGSDPGDSERILFTDPPPAEPPPPPTEYDEYLRPPIERALEKLIREILVNGKLRKQEEDYTAAANRLRAELTLYLQRRKRRGKQCA